MSLRHRECRPPMMAPASVGGIVKTVDGSGTVTLVALAHMFSYAYPFPVMAKQKLPPEELEERRKNWLAPAGSMQERRMLEKLAKLQALDEKFRALVYAYLAKPDGFAERNALFWQAAKKQILGDIVYEIALERHRKLGRPNEWIIACLISQGLKQEEIVPIIAKSLATVEKAVASIKDIIRRELNYDIEAVNLTQITRWFLGL